MRNIYSGLKLFVYIIAIMVFFAGIIMTILGGYELVASFFHLGFQDFHRKAGSLAIGLLNAVDLFLVAIVFFVLSLGMLVLFNDPEQPVPVKLPSWLQLKNFTQLKMILWEAILTTLVVSFLARITQRRIDGLEITYRSLLVPGSILLIALSLYLLKKGEH